MILAVLVWSALGADEPERPLPGTHVPTGAPRVPDTFHLPEPAYPTDVPYPPNPPPPGVTCEPGEVALGPACPPLDGLRSPFDADASPRG